MNPRLLSIESLAQQCEDQTRRFSERLEADTRYCLELLRRALQDQVQLAFTLTYRIYAPQVRRWVLGNWLFRSTGEPDPEPFVSDAFRRFYFALRGEKFARFDSLEGVLQYLKFCVKTAILEHLRLQKRAEGAVVISLDEDEASERIAVHDQPLDRGEAVWRRVETALVEEPDRRLVDLRFRQGYTPAEIARHYAADWPSPRHVSVALQRVCRTLRRDAELRQMLGDDDA